MQDITGKVFTLSSQIEVRDLADGTRLLKQLARVEYLALTPAQQAILLRFDGYKTVEIILHELLQSERQPDIRGFYDLVMAAMDKGFLTEQGGLNPIEVKIETTGQSENAWLGLFLALVAFVGGCLVFVSSGWRPFNELSEWFQVLLFTGLGLSLSNIWAASALNSFGRSIYNPRIRWERLVPYFSVDTRDAFMGGRSCEISVAAQAFASPFLLAVFGWMTGSETAVLGSALTAVVLGSPFGETPAHTLLHALLRKEYELPRCADQFLNTKLVATLFNWQLKLKEERYFLGYSTYAILWLGVTFRLANQLMAAHGRMVVQLVSQGGPDEDRLLPLIIYWLLAIVLLGIIAYLIWITLRGVYREVAPKFFHAEDKIRQSAATGTKPGESELTRFLNSTLLCGELADGVKKELASAMQYVVVDAGKTIIRERDSGEAMFLVFEGKVEVLKEDESGRNQHITFLGRGDAFGEIALLDKVPRTSSVKAVGRTALLVLSRADFERILVSNLGSTQIKTLIQISAFLRRNPLFAKWHPQALLQVSREFILEECALGQVVLKQGQVNDAFYMVYDGEFVVNQGGKTVAKLQPGDFCGEISLLRNIPATADVVATGKARCLKLSKSSFLRLVSHDFLTGLTIESTVMKRQSTGNRRGA